MPPLRIVGAALAVSALLAAAPASPSLYGFAPSSSAAERVDEARFLDIPSAQAALDDAAVIGAHPHYDGSAGDEALARWALERWALERFRSYGLDARIESFVARVDTPLTLALELYPTGERYVPRDAVHRARGIPPLGLDLRERGIADDPPTLDPAIGLPFNAGSADGDVVAPLAYANRGLPADYATLAAAGVDVRGAVVLVRYGAAFRGLLAQNAQRAGARAMILYDDPADDGSGRGPAYPHGPWRPTSSVQRGSVGEGIDIPVLPISADNAQILMRALRGKTGPDGWRGGLDAPYALGKGPAFVHLVVRLARTRRTLWNTIATIPGTTRESIVLGAHRDAWVYGVGDDGAGTITLLEAARALGTLARGGWRPKRSVVFALWDGEELGLYGSGAFTASHERELREGCVAYLNADEDITGLRVFAAGDALLTRAIGDASAAVPDPAHQVESVRARWERQRGGFTLTPPEGGSDHESFMRFGIPVAELGFAGPFGVYHSSYDTLRYAQTWSDPGFVLHRTNAQLYGLLAMRFADADALPYAFAALVAPLRAGLAQLALRHPDDAGLVALRNAIDAFARVAPSADAATERGTANSYALAAAREIDAVLYGTIGYASVIFPGIVAAEQRGDDVTRAREIERARVALQRATDDLR